MYTADDIDVLNAWFSDLYDPYYEAATAGTASVRGMHTNSGGDSPPPPKPPVQH